MAKIAANTDQQTKDKFVAEIKQYNADNIGRVSQDGLVNLLLDAFNNNPYATIETLHQIKFLKK